METELSFGQTTFLLWVPPFLSYELWKLRIELWKHLVQTGPYLFTLRVKQNKYEQRCYQKKKKYVQRSNPHVVAKMAK